jgi:oxygen-independent coproporphyrinogen-3 oxidase
MKTIRDHVPVLPSADITLEVNPEDVDPDAARGWEEAGINRISVGVQSFSNLALQWMHRVHDSARAQRALEVLVSRFARVSADLIFALPSDVERDLLADVRLLLQSGVGHISVYGLTAEPQTPFARWVERGKILEAPDERYESEFLALHDTLAAEQFEHYEVSSFAKAGHRSAHNAAYWSGAAYVGLGPAAHGYNGAMRRWNIASYPAWVAAVTSGADPVADSETLSAANRLAEEVYLGLRVVEGLPLLPAEAELQSIASWREAGWGSVAGQRLRLSPLGWLRLDSLAVSLTDFRSR